DADDGAGGARAGAGLGDPARPDGGRAGGRVRRRSQVRRGGGGGDRRAVRRADHADHGAANDGDRRVVMLHGIGNALMVLGASLALFGGALWLIRRLTGRPIGARSACPLEVLGRVTGRPRQGVTALRVGRRVVLISAGEGGPRPLLAMPEAEWSDAVAAESGGATGMAHDFRARLLRSLRGSASVVIALALADAATPAEARAGEWGVVATGAMLQAVPTAPAPPNAVAQQGGRALPQGFVGLPRIDLQIGKDDSGLRLSGTVAAVVVIGLLTLLPTLLLLMTSFTRILIVLHLVRQALGTQTTPPA